MSKLKLLGIITVVLFLCNVTLMWQVWKGNKMPERRGEGPRLEIIARLRLDDAQIKEYDILVGEHRSMMRQKEEEIRILKKAVYLTLISDSSSRDSLIQCIANQQKEVEHINLDHFADIGKLCHLDQKEDYNKLVADLSELFMHKKPPPGRR